MVSSCAKFAIAFLSFCVWKECCGLSENFLNNIALIQSDKDKVIRAHNNKRKLPNACNMKEMKWDEDLAKDASEFLKECTFDHADDLGSSGENLHFGINRLSEIFGIVVDAWYSEIDFYNYTELSCLPGKVCTHYTQLVWAATEYVGCAIAECSAIENNPSFGGGQITGCRYSPRGNRYLANTISPPYQFGEKCTCCDNGSTCDDDDDDGLCAQENKTVTSTVAQFGTTTAATRSTMMPITTTPDVTSTTAMHNMDTTVAEIAFSTTDHPTTEPPTTVHSTPSTPHSTAATDISTTDRPTTELLTTVHSTPSTPHSTAATDISTTDRSTTESLTTVHSTPSTPHSTAATVTTDAPSIQCQAEYLKMLTAYDEALKSWNKCIVTTCASSNQCQKAYLEMWTAYRKALNVWKTCYADDMCNEAV